MILWPALTVITIILMVLFFFIFEKRRASAERIVLISILSALSSVGRILFVALPSVQPSSFIIIMTGIVLGAEAGGMTGVMTALVSSLALGFGPWTPWQMFAWGLMGLTAGLIKKPLLRNKILRVIFGVVWGFFFGWIMNIWMLMSVDSVETGGGYIMTVYAASFLFDGLHAVANAFLIIFGGNAFIKVLSRISIKYGMVSSSK